MILKTVMQLITTVKDKLTDINKAKSYIKSGGKIDAIKAKYQLTSAQEAELKTL